MFLSVASIEDDSNRYSMLFTLLKHHSKFSHALVASITFPETRSERKVYKILYKITDYASLGVYNIS